MTAVAPAGDRRDDALLRLARGLLCCSVFLSSLLVARVGDYTAGDIVLILAIGTTLFAAAAGGVAHLNTRLPVVAIAVIALVVGGGALSGLRALSVASTLSVVARLVLVFVVLPWLARVLFTDGRRLRTAYTAFVAGCGVCGAGTILQFVAGPTIIPNTGVTDAGRFAGFTQNVSDMGGISCAGVVVGLALLMSATTRRARIVPLLAIVGSVFGLLLSGSVSGLISTAAGFAVLVVVGVVRPRQAVASIAGFVALLVVVIGIQTAAGALNPLQRILQTTGNSADARYDTAGSRVSTYTEALRKISENPVIGAGLDPTSTIVDGIYPAHNLFIAAMFSGGILLLLGVALAVARPFLGGALARAREPLVGIGLAALTTEFVFTMTAPSLYNRYFWIPVALLLAALALPRRAATPESAPADRRAAGRSDAGTPSWPADRSDAYARAGDPAPRRPAARHAEW